MENLCGKTAGRDKYFVFCCSLEATILPVLRLHSTSCHHSAPQSRRTYHYLCKAATTGYRQYLVALIFAHDNSCMVAALWLVHSVVVHLVVSVNLRSQNLAPFVEVLFHQIVHPCVRATDSWLITVQPCGLLVTLQQDALVQIYRNLLLQR